jgi:hypothetical protein
MVFLFTACAPSAERRTDAPHRDSATLAVVGTAPGAAVAEAPGDTNSVRFDASGRPMVPIVLHDYCAGEDCVTKFDAVACIATALRGGPADSSAIVTTVAEGDSLRVEHRDLRIPRVGTVVTRTAFVLGSDTGVEDDDEHPRSDTVRFAAGDTVYLIAYGALGSWSWAHHGMEHASQEFWATAPDHALGGVSDDSSRAVGLSTPTTEDWWFVRPRTGQPGWWHADGHEELQSVGGMEHWADDCTQVRKRTHQR